MSARWKVPRSVNERSSSGLEAFGSRSAFASLLLGATLAIPTLAIAQTVMPEQRLSTTISTRYHDPQLRAAGTRVFGAWGGTDSYPNNVSYGFSLDRGLTWANEATLPLALPPEWGAHLPLSMHMDSNGAVSLLVDHIGHFYYRAPALPSPSWKPAVVFGYEGGNYDRPDDLPAIAADAASHAVYASFTRCTNSYESEIWFHRSLDDGATWSTHVDLSSPNCNGSSMVIGPDGNLYVSWVDYALGQVLLRRSTDRGGTFSLPTVVASILDNLASAPVGWMEPIGTGLRSYPYYRSGISGGAANFPALAIDRSKGSTRGTLYLTWAEHAAGTPAPALTTVFDSNPNNSAAEAQLVSLDCDIHGGMPAGGDTGPFDFDWYVFDGVAGQTIILDGSASSYNTVGCTLHELLPNGSLLALTGLIMPGWGDPGAHIKPPIVTLPRTGRYFLSLSGVTVQGFNYTLRLRRWNVAPGSLCRDMRDIVLVRSTDGGTTWSPKVRVNHDNGGADQHQPNVAVDEQGRVFVAWYDRRESALGNQVRPMAAVSTDGGITFGPDLPLSNNLILWDGSQSAELVGDRIALAAGDNFGMAAWTDFRDWPNRCDIYGARIVDVPTAVAAVSDLTAEPLAGAVRLRWRVNDARGLAAIEVLRAERGNPEQVIGSAEIGGAEGEAEYLDASAEPGLKYEYRLRITANGSSYLLGPMAVQTMVPIDALALRSAGPNPFSAGTSMTLAVPRAAEGAVRIYDVQGKVVRTLREGALEPGELRLEWDGRDAAGFEAAPGLYFVAAQVGVEHVRAKLTRVR